MQNSFLKVFHTPDPEVIAKSEKYGYASMLLAKSRSHASYPIRYLSAIIAPAIDHGNIKFYFNSEGSLVGYVIWALLAPDVEERILRDGRIVLHPSEWNEGDRLWIIDFLAPFGNLKYMMRDLRDVVFPEQQEIRYFRIRKNGFSPKALSRMGHGHFFRCQRMSVDECRCGTGKCKEN